MCGISGVFSSKKIDDNLIKLSKSINEKIAHRGPDNTGIFYDINDKIILNHKRLSIIDLTKNGNQPFFSQSQRFIVTFNGEIYNHLELRKNFFPQNFSWKSSSDTETLVEFIEKYGFQKFFDEADGMYAFVIWDRKHKTIHLCRDIFGEKPLYFGLINGDFIFSSELKSFEIFLDKLSLEEEAIKEFLELSYIPSPKTIYKNILKLEKSIHFSFSINDLLKLDKKQNYFSNILDFYNSKKKLFMNIHNLIREQKNKKKFDIIDYKNLVHNELRSSIKKRMRSDVDFGVFLSGGIDSSLVTSIMSEISNKKIKTFTVASTDKNFDEGIKAKKISQILNTDHNEIVISPNDQIKTIENLPEIFDEPFADSSQLPILLLSEYARKKVKVVLTGDGADEIFKGYNRHLYSFDLWKKIKKIPPNLKPSFYKILYSLKPSFLLNLQNFINFFLYKNNQLELLDEKIYKIADAILNSNNLQNHYIGHLSIWQNNEDIICKQNLDKTSKKLLKDFHIDEKNYNDIINLLDLHSYLPDDILVKTDRATMNFSLEARTPYLTKNMLELSLNSPAGGLIENKVGKAVLRKILDDYLPPNIMQGAKKGFSVPIKEWLKKDLKSWADDLFNSEILKSCTNLNSSIIMQYWQDHKSGKKNYHKRLWNVLVLINWAKQKKKLF